MIYNKIFRKIKKILGIKPQMLFADASAHVEVSTSARIQNSKIELKGNSKLIICDDVVITGTYILLEDSELTIASNVEMSNVNLFAKNNSNISISHSVRVDKYDWMLEKSVLIVGDNCIFNQGRNALRPYFNISQGQLHFADHNVIRAEFWIRFGGIVAVGQYNCINERTELRCDESIKIGDFNMISYDCNIWDTNTHCIYSPSVRREKTIFDFPVIGSESERPKTKPVIIGNDCWVGKGSVILKGSVLENEAIVATRAIVSNQTVGKHQIAKSAKAEIISVIKVSDQEAK